jgi:arsenate reductase
MKPLQHTIQELQERSMLVPGNTRKERLATLDQLAHWISGRPLTEPIDITVICTHNSRRSHLGQVWLQAAAWHYEFDNLRTWSGGTEGTALYPSAAEALRSQGVELSQNTHQENPIYRIQLQSGQPPFDVFSKRYSHPSNPQSGFAAILVCNEANEACPIVSGSVARFSLPYEDPKISDGTEQESRIYQERSKEIGAEMFYIIQRARAIMTASQP